MTISLIIFVKKYYLFQKCSTSTCISFIVSYLPIPPSSLGTSGPEHRPSQENNVHHKIKDEQQDTEQIQCIYQGMHTGRKEENLTSTASVLDQPSINTHSTSWSTLAHYLNRYSASTQLTADQGLDRHSIDSWSILTEVLTDSFITGFDRHSCHVCQN